MLNHPLSYTLTAIADVPSVYLQQLWKTVGKVPDTKGIHNGLMWHHSIEAVIWSMLYHVQGVQLVLDYSNIWHDQTKIDILKLFHAVVNRVYVDYAALLWWDFLNYMFQTKDVIQYPHFTKLIITDLMKKFPSIPQRLEEDYHSIKDDILLVSVYSTGNVLF
ncbi:hypothetical protein Tco_1117278 [Tanacetum coccineum]